ncbi:hypothetical protein ACTWQB_14755 [Piscibacillus sp. B03]|uniref:hypothetical protein n=1 Tax=Piscibacillus sp. B03 TaxID=3457430 RepID=UPI003FCD7938
MKRMDILFQINQLEEELKVAKSEIKKNEIENQLRDLGQKLLSLTNSKRKRKNTKQKTKTLNQTSKSKGDHVMDNQAAKTNNNLRDLDNELLHKKDMSEEEKNNCLSQLKSFDIEKIEQLREQGFTLGEMALQLGMQYQYFCQKRRKAINELRKETNDSSAESPEEESPRPNAKTIPLDDHINRMKEFKNQHKKETNKLFEQINELLNTKKEHETTIEQLQIENNRLVEEIQVLSENNDEMKQQLRDKGGMKSHNLEKINRLEKLLALYLDDDRTA